MQKYKCRQKNICKPYNYRQEIENELINSLPSHLATTLSINKVIRTVSSILKINLLECSLLSWLLKCSKYSLNDLSDSTRQIALFEEDQNKQLLLLIILNAYYVKSFLSNKSCSPPQIDHEVLSFIPNFAKIYKNWRPDSSLEKVSLSELNISFNNWTQNNQKSKPDYNNLVNKILELSKTYNVGANEQDVVRKKRKVNEEESHSEMIKNRFQQPSPKKSYLLRSSAHFRQKNEQQQYDNHIWQMQERRSSHDFLKKSKTMNASLGYMNFSDIRESKQLFPFANNVNGSIDKSIGRWLQKGSGGWAQKSGNERSVIRPKIKVTSSFEEIFK